MFAPGEFFGGNLDFFKDFISDLYTIFVLFETNSYTFDEFVKMNHSLQFKNDNS